MSLDLIRKLEGLVGWRWRDHRPAEAAPLLSVVIGEIKPCPFRHRDGGRCVVVSHSVEAFFVRCDQCGACGPVKKTLEKACNAWNRGRAGGSGLLDALERILAHDLETDGATSEWVELIADVKNARTVINEMKKHGGRNGI